MKIKDKRKIIIAGPCALESQEQMIETLKEAKKLAVDFVRLSLWKPRTQPGFEGIGEEGIPLLVEAAKMGVNPGIEPLIPSHAEKVVNAVLPVLGNGKLLLWIGARNQNHFIQREMAEIASQDDRIYLMAKNQIWNNEKHWEGIVDHVLEGGIKKENFWLCHRGFAPHGDNPDGYRNIPDYAMTMRIKEKTGLPMIFDPSHTGGNVENVIRITKEANQYDFDGYIVEVHPDPKNAITDAQQQLTWGEFKQLLEEIGER
jgi:3-deoxy-D-arabino-heptulosonate 7-phosphate (DAHP) synthase